MLSLRPKPKQPLREQNPLAALPYFDSTKFPFDMSARHFLGFLMMLGLVCRSTLFGQDIIIPFEGESLRGDVTRVGTWHLRYIPVGETKSERMRLREVELVIFESGMKQSFAVKPSSVILTPDSSLRPGMIVATDAVPMDSIEYWVTLGRQDADQYFDAMGAFWGTAAATCFFPYLGLFLGTPAGIIIAAIPPNIDSGDIPNVEAYYKNQYYAEGYRNRAHGIKVRRVLQGFGTGLLVQAVTVVVIVLASW